VYSALLLYISRTFSNWILHPGLPSIPKDQFKQLLKHKFLCVSNEDEVVRAICTWAGQGGADPDSLKEVLENVNWNYVSVAAILDLLRNHPTIRRVPSFQNLIRKEMAMRLKFNPEQSKVDPPRYAYKFRFYPQTFMAKGAQPN